MTGCRCPETEADKPSVPSVSRTLSLKAVATDGRPMSPVDMAVSSEPRSETDGGASACRGRALARYARPVLGLILPVGLALGWEIAVRLGWANGRLVPPPSQIFHTLFDLARGGELGRH